ncbi:MAG: tRNA1(Val) (adenine(37)-N6)-methyltransferase [Nitrospirae bacterium]|nr:tRNA1(Val) (adenine(37)-N6)-methyltransferase [Nitrospirota bacterium]
METLDSIKIRDLEVEVYQTKSGYRFSLDALLLADFPEVRTVSRILELGAGSGVVSLLLAKRYPKAKVVGVEIQDGLFGRAVRNAEVNGLSGRVEFMHIDLKELPKTLPPEGFDLVVMNPPFRKPGTGKISPGDERAIARHEMTAGLDDMLKSASAMLRNRGRLCIVYNPTRLAELFHLMRENALEPKRLRTIHSTVADEASMALIEAVKCGASGMKVLPPLFVYESHKVYTAEMRAFYGFKD